MRALQELEATGFITRRSQFHDSGAQGSTPYYLNHPQAPHPAPRSDLGRGVPKRDPLNPPLEPPTEPAADATRVLAAFTGALEGWQEGCRNLDTRHRGCARVGLDPRKPHPAHFTEPRWRPKPRTGPGSTPSRPTPPAPRSCPPTIAWCGECEDERSRTITITIAMPDGTEAAAFCPRCSPQAQRKARDSYPYVKEMK